jgi:hypothetical protein
MISTLRAVFGGLAFGVSSALLAEPSCSDVAIARFIIEMQSLTIDDNARSVHGTCQQSSAVWFWTEFYRAMIRGERSELPAFPLPPAGSDELIHKARESAGRGQFATALAIYLDLLRARPANADAIEAEWLFTIIWQGDHQTARQKVRRVDLSAATNDLRQTYRRAAAILANKNPEAPPAADRQNAALTAAVSTARKLNVQNDLVVAVDWRADGWGVRCQLWQLDPEAFREARRNSSEIAGQYRAQYFGEHSFELGAYANAKAVTIIGAAQTRYQIAPKVLASVKLLRRPLETLTPLPAADATVMRDKAAIEVNGMSFVAMQFAVIRDGTLPYWDDVTLEGRYGIDAPVPLHLVMPLNLEWRARPSPYYPTAAETRAFGLGIEVGQRADRVLSLGQGVGLSSRITIQQAERKAWNPDAAVWPTTTAIAGELRLNAVLRPGYRGVIGLAHQHSFAKVIRELFDPPLTASIAIEGTH